MGISPSEVTFETVEPLQHRNISFDLGDQTIPPWFLHWPILLEFKKIHTKMLSCEQKKNQRPWLHFTPKCNLLKGH